jgi:hypothetical protein
MDKMRWRYGDTNPVVAAVDADVTIEIGDLLWLDVDDAKPASLIQRDDFSQEWFAGKFLGVAMQRSRIGDTAPIRVATTGVFEFDCHAIRCELGDLVGVDVVNGIFNQRIMPVNGPQLAIARVAKRSATPVTSMLVDIRSTVMTGGIR